MAAAIADYGDHEYWVSDPISFTWLHAHLMNNFWNFLHSAGLLIAKHFFPKDFA